MENIVENNKLIAEFMGWKKIDNYYDNIAFNVPLHLASDDRDVDFESEDGQIKYVVEPEYLKFISDWNWLMEVVEKIESIKWEGNDVLSSWTSNPFQIRIQGSDVGIILDGVGDNSKVKDTKHYSFYDVDWRNCKTKIELVYLTCVAFIKWYNEQNK